MQFIQKCTAWFMQFIIANLFITLVSLPILIAWGLPISWLSPVGNLVFNPFLSLLLFLGTISFFSALIGISHAPLNWAIEWLSWIWHYLLRIAPDQNFIGFSTTGLWLMCVLSMLTFLLMLLPQFRHTKKRLFALIFLFGCSVMVLKVVQPAQVASTILGKHKSVEIIKQNDHTLLIDDGAFCEHADPSSWVQYHLIPELIQKTGTAAIDYVIITRPSIRSFQAVIALMQYGTVGTIYYPEFKGIITGSHRTTFRKCYAIAKEKKILMKRINEQPIEIEIGDKKITFSGGKKTKYREVVYPQIIFC